MRAILFVIAAIAALSARPVPAQEASPPTAPPQAAAPQREPVYSLVIARATTALPFPDFYGDRCALCLNPIHIAGFDSAQVLAGPPIAAEFGATIFWHSWFTHGAYPMLLVVRHLNGGLYHVAAYARGPDADGMGCLRREEVAAVGWRPEGPGIVAHDGAICASLAELAALPQRPDPRFDTPVTVLSIDEIDLTPPSLIVARRVSERESDLPPCPPGTNCWQTVRDLRLADVKTLGGPRVPSRLRARLLMNEPSPPGDDLVLVVSPPGDDGHWIELWVRPVTAEGDDVCISRQQLFAFGLREPRGSYRRDDEVCFPV